MQKNLGYTINFNERPICLLIILTLSNVLLEIIANKQSLLIGAIQQPSTRSSLQLQHLVNGPNGPVHARWSSWRKN